jgi:hypothetical protein
MTRPVWRPRSRAGTSSSDVGRTCVCELKEMCECEGDREAVEGN